MVNKYPKVFCFPLISQLQTPGKSDFWPLLSKVAQLQKKRLSGPAPASKAEISLNNQKALYFSKSSWQCQYYLQGTGCPSSNNEEIIIIIKNYYYAFKYIEGKQCAKRKNIFLNNSLNSVQVGRS